jgi:hypothetical protein
MLNMLHNGLVKIASRQSEKELSHFVDLLSSMDSDELGLVVAGATDIRHKLFHRKGWALLYPSVELAKDPAIAMDIGGLVKELQRQQNLAAAAALMVWAHSIRAMSQAGGLVNLRKIGRRMWGELARGFDCVEQAAETSEKLTGVSLNIEGYRQFPDGLTPEPL